MLAAGTMARKYGPTVADLAGKAHEYSTSPLRALMMMLGRGEMPPDYKLDMHNNALGIEMARRAKSQRELEDLVQQAAERSAKTQTEGRPWVNKAKGGEVSADDLNQPYIGYRSAGRRPESQQDRRAAADAPLSALRGAVSGMLGAPGDIESLIRMLPGLSERTVLPTSEDVEKRLPMPELNQTPTGRAFTTAGQLGGGFYTGPGAPLRAVAALPSAVSRAGRDFVMAAGQPAVNVVKPKGGNWLAGSVERSIEPMRQTTLNELGLQNLAERAGADVSESVRINQQPQVAMNRWLETKLGKYIKNEMATPEDPLRALAERGVMHYEPSPTSYYLKGPRAQAGFPEEGMGVSDLAKTWEGRADTFINELRASDITQGYPGEIEKNPWLLKVPPETRVYDMLRGANEDLGFGHLVDELRNAVNPESGLPANLRLKYQDLEKVTVPQAVERVAKINDWRAAQKAEADMARAMNPATQVVKEYPEQGFKWVELRQPKELPEGWAEARKPSGEVGAYYDPSGATVYDHPGVKTLEDALKYEGETMGHCVGGYCPDVVEGRSKIYSLRDKKGQPHVTIEVQPGEGSVYQYLASKNLDLEKEAQKLYPKSSKIASQDLLISDIEATPEYAEWVRSLPQEIVQIKGSGKKDPGQKIRHSGTGYKDNPDAHLLPAVQDFIRSGNWGRIGDAQNAGLRKFTDVFSSNELHMLQDAGAEFPNSGWLTGEDIQRLHNMITPEGKRLKYDAMGKIVGGDEASGFSGGGQVRGYAEGGIVNQTVNQPTNQANIYNSDAKQDPASAYKFADGGFAGSVPGYAAGGVVSGANFPTDDFDPARIDAIVGELHALNAG